MAPTLLASLVSHMPCYTAWEQFSLPNFYFHTIITATAQDTKPWQCTFQSVSQADISTFQWKMSEEIYWGIIHTTQVLKIFLSSDFMTRNTRHQSMVFREGWELPGSTWTILNSHCTIPGGAFHPPLPNWKEAQVCKRKLSVSHTCHASSSLSKVLSFSCQFGRLQYVVHITDATLAWDKFLSVFVLQLADSNGSLNNSIQK